MYWNSMRRSYGYGQTKTSSEVALSVLDPITSSNVGGAVEGVARFLNQCTTLLRNNILPIPSSSLRASSRVHRPVQVD